MEKLTAKLSESILDKLSMDFLRSQVLKNAYGNDDTVIAALDPRVLLAWYLFFGLVPWFVSDIPFLLGCFLLVMALRFWQEWRGWCCSSSPWGCSPRRGICFW